MVVERVAAVVAVDAAVAALVDAEVAEDALVTAETVGVVVLVVSAWVAPTARAPVMATSETALAAPARRRARRAGWGRRRRAEGEAAGTATARPVRGWGSGGPW